MHTAFAFQPYHRAERTNTPVERGHQARTPCSTGRLGITKAADPNEGARPIVFVVDDRPFIGASLDLSGETLGWDVRHFHSTAQFLEGPPILSPSCLVLESAMPELDLLELQERVAVDRPGMPIVLVTARDGTLTTLHAIPTSTVKILASSIGDDLLAYAIANAIERSRPVFSGWAHTRDLRSRFDSLSGRERQVMALVVSGKLNKQVGGDLGISEITVKAHRGNAMRKMRAKSLPNLVAMAARLGLAVPDDGTS